MNRGFGFGGGRLATRRRSSSGYQRICVSGGCRVESDGAARTSVSGPSRSCSSIETIASESETIESFRRGSRIREVELPRLDGGIRVMVDDSSAPIQYPQRQNPKRRDSRIRRFGIRAHRVGIGVSVEDLSFEAQPPSRAVFRKAMLRTTNSDLIVGSHGSKSARQRQYPKRLKRV